MHTNTLGIVGLEAWLESVQIIPGQNSSTCQRFIVGEKVKGGEEEVGSQRERSEGSAYLFG